MRESRSGGAAVVLKGVASGSHRRGTGDRVYGPAPLVFERNHVPPSSARDTWRSPFIIRTQPAMRCVQRSRGLSRTRPENTTLARGSLVGVQLGCRFAHHRHAKCSGASLDAEPHPALAFGALPGGDVVPERGAQLDGARLVPGDGFDGSPWSFVSETMTSPWRVRVPLWVSRPARNAALFANHAD